ncbi:hypothetical protein E4U14_005039 [Claviceps sp. LM454 group G7]|nr:hypothetical protein E4U14_005039 [Claviceps sp. LM454 group G7]
MESLKCRWPYVSPKMLDFLTKAGSMDMLLLARYRFSISSNESSKSRADPLNMPENRETRKARRIVRSVRLRKEEPHVVESGPEDRDEVTSLWGKP